MGLSVGIKLGSHEIVSPLGAGGMGEVYRSRYAGSRDLAVKDLPLNRSTHGPQTAMWEVKDRVLSGWSATLPLQDYGRIARNSSEATDSNPLAASAGAD
jgi:hypothetical protein